MSPATASPTEETRLHWAADLAMAAMGLALEAVAAFYVVIAAGLSNLSDPHGSNGGADRADLFLLFGLGFLLCLALLLAILFRAKAPITALLQLLTAGALILAVLTTITSDHRSPAPAPSQSCHDCLRTGD